MTGFYHIALLPETDEKSFVDHMRGKVFDLLQPTRVTRGFTHTLLKSAGDFREYTWLVSADLVGDSDYDFDQNRERLQKALAGVGLLVGIDSYLNLED